MAGEMMVAVALTLIGASYHPPRLKPSCNERREEDERIGLRGTRTPRGG